MRFKEEWKRIGYNNPKIKEKDLDKIMSDDEALEFFNKLMQKYITLKKLDLDKESDRFVITFKATEAYIEKDWSTWLYRTLPGVCQDDKLTFQEALGYRNIREMENKNITTILNLFRYVG